MTNLECDSDRELIAGREAGYDCREIANYILDRCEQNGAEMTNLSLQKVLYFCHATTLANLGRPLIKQSFEAWKHGPVIPSLYREFKIFGEKKISSRAHKIDLVSGNKVCCDPSLDHELREALNKSIDFYSRISSFYLVQLSHEAGSPWDKVWNHTGNANPGMKITNQDITNYYRARESEVKKRKHLN